MRSIARRLIDKHQRVDMAWCAVETKRTQETIIYIFEDNSALEFALNGQWQSIDILNDVPFDPTNEQTWENKGKYKKYVD